MKFVRAIEIDRARSSVVDIHKSVDSPWRVCFRLKPRPPRSWDDHFERAVRTAGREQQLESQHVLAREPRDEGYHYGRRRTSILRRIRLFLLRKRRLSVYVTCQPSAEDLRRATHELAELIAHANAGFVESTKTMRDLSVAEDIAVDRLQRAIDSLEKSALKSLVRNVDDMPRKAQRPTSLAGR